MAPNLLQRVFRNLAEFHLPWSQRFFLSRERAKKRWRRVPKRREEKNLWLPWTWISLSSSRQGQDLTLRLGLVDTFYKHANQYDWFVWPVMPRGLVIAKLPLVPFVIINLTRLTAGVCMKVRFKSKVTRGFSLLAASRLSRLKKNLWDQGKFHLTTLIRTVRSDPRSY